MIRTTVTDAIATTAAILFLIAVIVGDTASGTDWAIRAFCVYPFTHLAWRAYRHAKQI